MSIIEKKWDNIKKSIKLAVELASSFGYGARTLTSANALIPISYFIMKIGASDTFIQSSRYQNERLRIRKWLAVSLIKRVFSVQPDNVLRQIRALMQGDIQEFPIESIKEKFKGTNKSITFSDDDIENLFYAKYGQNHTFSILALLYPTLDYRNRFHQDHIFPKSWFKHKILNEKKIALEKHDIYYDNVDSITNLQILEGLPNEEKSNKDFKEWLEDIFKNKDDEKKDFMKKHHIPHDISLEFNNFEQFVNKRKELLKVKFKEVLQ